MTALDQFALGMTVLTIIAGLVSGLTASAATLALVILHGRRRAARGIAAEAAAYLAGQTERRDG